MKLCTCNLFRGAATISQHLHELNSKLVFYCKVLIIDFFRSTIHYLHIVYEGKNLCLFTVTFEEKLDLLITNTGLMCAFVMTFMPNRLCCDQIKPSIDIRSSLLQYLGVRSSLLSTPGFMWSHYIHIQTPNLWSSNYINKLMRLCSVVKPYAHLMRTTCSTTKHSCSTT